MRRSYDDPQAIRARRDVATAMSRQAHRLERQLEAIHSGASERLGNDRAGMVVWQIASKLAGFGHLVVAGYREGRYAPEAALVRTVFEEVSLLAWIEIPDDSDRQGERAIRVALGVYRAAQSRGYELPADAKRLMREAKGELARKTPSMGDRARQLDAAERRKPDGKEFWVTHIGHAEMLSDIVHPGFLGPDFADPMTRELLGYQALAFGHQYLAIGVVAAARLSGQSRLARRALDAFGLIHPTQMEELDRLIKE